jgi:hypothetical protein
LFFFCFSLLSDVGVSSFCRRSNELLQKLLLMEVKHIDVRLCIDEITSCKVNKNKQTFVFHSVCFKRLVELGVKEMQLEREHAEAILQLPLLRVEQKNAQF